MTPELELRALVAALRALGSPSGVGLSAREARRHHALDVAEASVQVGADEGPAERILRRG